MTNEELKKKICDVIAPYVSAYGDDERIADALILEGIGYVWDITEKTEKAIASLIKQNKELQHRAEVAERALKEFAGYVGCARCPYSYQCELPCVDSSNGYRACFETYVKEAEKDLAEERKDD